MTHVIYEAESTPHALLLIERHNIKYVFDTTHNWDGAVLREFSPCLLIDACIAGDLFEDGVLTRYDSYAYEVRGVSDD